MSAFFCKKSKIFGKKITFTQNNSVRAVLEIFYLCLQFFTDYGSGIRLSYCSKLAIDWQNNSDVTNCRHDARQTFLTFFVSLVKFSYWFKFHVNILFVSGVMTVFFYKGLTPFKFCLLNAAKCQSYNCYYFWVINGKPIVVKLHTQTCSDITTKRIKL